MIFVNFFTGNSVLKGVVSFLLKYGDQEALSWTSLFRTRMPLMEFMMANAKTSLLTGIGFGTSYDPKFVQAATWYSAPTEKGFIPLAVLEETGLSGSLFFWSFIVLFVIYLIRERNISGFGIFVTFMSANMGEMVFFSFGGAGGMCWFVVAAGLVLSDRCLTTQGTGGPRY